MMTKGSMDYYVMKSAAQSTGLMAYDRAVRAAVNALEEERYYKAQLILEAIIERSDDFKGEKFEAYIESLGVKP